MRQYDTEDLEKVIRESEGLITDVIKRSNSANTDLYNTIIKASEGTQQIRNKIAILGDMITDLSVINASTKNSIFLKDLDVYSSKNVEFNDNKITLSKTNETVVEFDAKTSVITSGKPYEILDLKGNTKTLESLFKYRASSKIRASSMGYSYDFILKLPKLNKINQIVIQLPITSVEYPSIQNVEALYGTNTYTKINIVNNNSSVFSLDENRVIGNKYIIDIDTVETTELKFTLFSKVSQELLLDYIELYYSEFESEGEIIFGPIVTDTPILKLGLTSSGFSDGISLQVSTNAIDWIDTNDSFKLTTDTMRKVVAFNTINDLSFRTEEEVNSVYIKVSIVSKEVESTSSLIAYDSYREDDSIVSPYISTVENNRLSAFRVRTNDLVYGANTYRLGIELTDSIKSQTDTITMNGDTKVLGFSDTLYSIGKTNNSYQNADVKLKPLRIESSSNIDASKFDSVSSELFDIITIPFTGDVNTLHTSNFVLKLVGKEDTYKLVASTSKQSLNISVTSDFSLNNSNTIFQVPDEDILLVSSIGEVLKEYKKENHYVVMDESTGNLINFISLAESIYQPPSITGYTFNPLYPIQALSKDEFGISDGYVILGSGSIVHYNGFKISKTVINKLLNISYQNGNTWERIDPLYTYHHQQIDHSVREKSVIKLDHISIQKGSLQIFEYTDYDKVEVESNVFISLENNNKKPSTEYIESEENTYIEE